MMEHIRQHDWCDSEPDNYFVLESDIDKYSVINKILANKFHDPLLASSESEDEGNQRPIHWDKIFKEKKENEQGIGNRPVVPGFSPFPPYPKLSALTIQQHQQLLRVLCGQNLDVMPMEFIGRAKKCDYKAFEELKEIYEKEQKEFIEWGKTMWTTHCCRVLRPKPVVEMVYDSEFKVAAHRFESFPKNFHVAAQIPLEDSKITCEMAQVDSLIKVSTTSLPQIKEPDLSRERLYITAAEYPAPEPCSKHPCRFMLPKENSMTILPLTEVQRELAEYAVENGAHCIASEEALRCLMELDRHWSLGLSVCSVMSIDGDGITTVVIDSEFSLQREPALVRTQKAFRKLLEYTLIPSEEKQSSSKYDASPSAAKKSGGFGFNDMDLSDEDEDQLIIDTGDLQINDEEPQTKPAIQTRSSQKNTETEADKTKETDKGETNDNKIDFYNCTCREPLDTPPSRSYTKWKVINTASNDAYSFIAHTPHTAKFDSGGEVAVEPISEYQVDLGVRELSPHTLRSQALVLMLRKNASILNVRIDAPTGEVVKTEIVHYEDFVKKHMDVIYDVHNRLYTLLDQLQGLLPGHYVLRHEPAHGNNAILYTTLGGRGKAAALTMHFDAALPLEADETVSLRQPPTLTTGLLPIHK
ncbi:uncharacterized protein LOC135073510 [Ostrinia nubilalis]|uniref:uncharacterized protein LOC135073510 n=1 Tax=Ostrinia nubilalis TaxID=29057 RepID=UPI00308244AF